MFDDFSPVIALLPSNNSLQAISRVALTPVCEYLAKRQDVRQKFKVGHPDSITWQYELLNPD
jgi:hypothetical protein